MRSECTVCGFGEWGPNHDGLCDGCEIDRLRAALETATKMAEDQIVKTDMMRDAMSEENARLRAALEASERLLDDVESIVTDGGGVSLHTKILNLLTVLLRRRGGRRDDE